MATKQTKSHGLKEGSRVRAPSGYTGKVVRIRQTLRGEYADISLTKDALGAAVKPPHEASVRPSTLVKF